MATTYNHGEPVFDQETGDLVIDPTTGDAVIVEPGEVWSDPVTGRSYSQDDVANALYYRVNTYEGEVIRDQRKGVDYHGVVFGMPFDQDLIVAEIRTTALETPGVAALTQAQLISRDPVSRSAVFAFRCRKKSGEVVPVAVTV